MQPWNVGYFLLPRGIHSGEGLMGPASMPCYCWSHIWMIWKERNSQVIERFATMPAWLLPKINEEAILWVAAGFRRLALLVAVWSQNVLFLSFRLPAATTTAAFLASATVNCERPFMQLNSFFVQRFFNLFLVLPSLFCKHPWLTLCNRFATFLMKSILVERGREKN